MNIKILLFSIGICLAAGVIGSFFTMDAIPNWYAGLTKPTFNPPNWVFGPVWTVLYILMGISLFLFSTTKTKASKQYGYTLFFLQLILNTLWSIIFFGFKSPFFAFIEIVLLFMMIILTIIEFYKIRKASSYLLIPYILWVSFASFLNLNIYLLNS